MTTPKPQTRARRKLWQIPLFILAWILQGVSEWTYTAAEWLYLKCDTDILNANIQWEDKSK